MSKLSIVYSELHYDGKITKHLLLPHRNIIKYMDIGISGYTLFMTACVIRMSEYVIIIYNISLRSVRIQQKKR